MNEVIEWMRHNGHKPGDFSFIEGCQAFNTLFQRMGCGEGSGAAQTSLFKQIFSIGYHIDVCTQWNTIRLTICFRYNICPCGMDKGLITPNLADELRGNRPQGIHRHQTADPGGTYVRNIRALSLRGNADELRPGIPPFHTSELNLNACFTFE